MALEYTGDIPVEDYQRLRAAAGWKTLPYEQAAAGLEHSFYTLCCRDGDKTVGILRMLWDFGYVAYLADVIVDEEYRGRGIGTEMINRAMECLKNSIGKDYKVKLLLLAAEGRESFYERFGFVRRPNKTLGEGAGMDQWITADE